MGNMENQLREKIDLDFFYFLLNEPPADGIYFSKIFFFLIYGVIVLFLYIDII